MNAPKEIFIPSATIEVLTLNAGQTHGMFYTTKKHETETKYLSEDHVKELLAEKDKENQLKTDYYEEKLELYLKIINTNNAEIESKNKEIERLKSELADVKQCLVFTISCIIPADFEEMKYKAKKLLNIE